MSDEPFDWKSAWYALDHDSKARIAELQAENARLRDALAIAQYGLSWGKANWANCGVLSAPPIARALDATRAALVAKP